MATKLSTSDKAHKRFAQNARRILKLYRDNDSKLYIAGPRERGGKGFGKFREIVEVFVDDRDNSLYVGYKINDESGLFRQYASLGRFLTCEVVEEEEKAV